jgi:PAS domain S-box-containing protein
MNRDNISRENQLEEENSLLRSQLNTIESVAKIGSWSYDLSTDMISLSSGIIEFAENDVSSGIISFNDFLKLVHPDDRANLCSGYYLSLDNKETFKSSFRVISNKTTTRWLSVKLSTTFSKDGEPQKSQGTLQDITETVVLKKKSLQVESNYLEIFENSPIGLIELDVTLILEMINSFKDEGVTDLFSYIKQREGATSVLASITEISNANKLALEILGAESTKEVQDNISHFFTENSFEMLSKLAIAISNSETVFQSEAQIRNVQNELIDIDIRCFFPISNDSSVISKVVISISDITKQNVTKKSVNWMSTVVEQIPLSIIITDLNGKIEYVNPFFSQITGYSYEEAIDENPRILKGEDKREDEYNDLWDIIKSEKIWKGEFSNKKKDGSFYSERATIGPIKNENGETIHYLAIKEDISEVKKLQDQLSQSQKMEAIGQLAGGVAHDFNNILTAIHGHADIATSLLSPENSIYDELIEIIHAADRASNLTRQLLTFSRNEKVKRAVFEANSQVEHLEKMINRLIPEDIRLYIALAKKELTLFADAGQFEQIVVNLVVNSIDALRSTNSAREKRITLSTEMSKDGSKMRLSVSDNGCGIEKSIINRIFEPFFTTKGKNKGTGLGLSTIYGIVKQNGADISVESEIEKGTKFIIDWPLSKRKAKKVENKKVLKLTDQKGTETILFVEDDDHIRRLIQRHLTSLGYTIISATNGLEALDLASDMKKPADLLFTDIIMPLMDGHKLAVALKTAWKELPVLFASGYLDDDESDESSLEQREAFIHKPYKIAEIGAKIRELLD